MKKLKAFLTSVLAIAILSTSSIVSSGEEVTPIYGDLDNDKKITSADSLYVLRTSVGLEKPTDAQKIISDVDSDNIITSSDALEILRYSVDLPTEGVVGKECVLGEVDIPAIREPDTDEEDTPPVEEDYSAYFPPYDIDTIRKDMIEYGKSLGLRYVPEVNIEDDGYEVPLLTDDYTYWFGKVDGMEVDLKRECLYQLDMLVEDARFYYDAVPEEIQFNVQIVADKRNPGEYLIYVPYC